VPHSAPPFAPHHRKINCALQDALAEKVVGCDAPAAPQNQLHSAECTCRKSCIKICVVGCGVLRGLGA